MSLKKYFSAFKKEPKSVYIFIGEDNFLKKQIVNFTKNELKNSHTPRKFSSEENSVSEAIDIFKNSTLFGDKYLIYGWVEEISDKEKKNLLKLIENIDKHENSNVLLLFFKKLRANDKILKLADSKNCLFHLTPPSHSQLKSYIAKFFQQKGIEFEPQVPEFLMETLNNNLEAISLELQKILNSDIKEKKITVKFLEKIILSTKEENIFNLVNSFLDKKKQESLKLFHHLTELNTDTESVINMFLSTINTMIIIKDGKTSNIPDSEIISKFKIHPYSYKKNSEKAKRYSKEELYHIFYSLLKLQFDIRGKGIDKKIAFKNFLLLQK